jgi:predicted outer membrane repeat protein
MDCLAGDSGGAAALIGGGGPRFEDCTFAGNQAAQTGGAISFTASEGTTVIQTCVIENNVAGVSGGALAMREQVVSLRDSELSWNRAEGRGGAIHLVSTTLGVVRSTLVLNEAPQGGGIALEGPWPATLLFLAHSIISHSVQGGAVFDFDGGPLGQVECTDIFANQGGDWTESLAPYAPLNSNFSLDPEYCGVDEKNFTLQSDSPCAEGNSGECGRVGAYAVGCGPVSIESLSWGRIKSLHR